MHPSAAEDATFLGLACTEAAKSPPIATAYCVGCVVVGPEGSVLATGFSRELHGNTHAEECALRKAIDLYGPDAARGSTLYTTMEPCSLRLSGALACVEHIVAAQVARVVLGVAEPKTFVQCEGVRRLQEAGVQVVHLAGLERLCLLPNRHLDEVRRLLDEMPGAEM